MTARARLHAKPEDWTNYASGDGGWFAWNGRTGAHRTLVSSGSFSEAIDHFDRLFGSYYASRHRS